VNNAMLHAEISLSRINSIDKHAIILFFVLSIRLFVSKCAKCHQSFSKNDLFIRTTFYRRFHTDCFRCDHCDRLLTSGDEYYLHRQNEILCRQHFQQLNETSSTTESKSSCSDSGGGGGGGAATAGKNVCRAYTLTSVRM
jgi:phage FluMu protein Com